jgi:RNA polymerase sigma-70 factor (ECF subfamily)
MTMEPDVREPAPEATAAAPPPAVVAALVAHHRAFLAYVQRRVGDRAQAEEILQAAFVRSLDKLDTVRDTAVGWFYGAAQRDASTAAPRRLEAYAQAQPEAVDEELHRVVCACVGDLAATLKPEYATALRRIEIDGVAVKDYAAEAGITTSNAGVRVFRAREALRAQVARACGTCADHGCLDCTCDRAPGHACGG